ncbi:uncharacterized protein HMPREF1541_09171 [Cyphellophora europaea CBS 101466]|uniref:Uncharacterized protein n=1 Tax=Cyphellophora europaea (strain CBS 101466) TaxID=1220924 RepID=W2S9L9_CYPE1|nr:uncharacterized protein HMPREF1541_09171 [Cyphellophora europaea CBS 101466]ETN45340.1 hypothetical protein HMPREF1541_09171 [Cyphellophora europaea CBS 101466]
MKKPAAADVVYHKTFPRPKQNDPNCFVAHIQRHLVPEVREEVQRYFGRIDCLEAQYPGLDYTFPPHRRRLASFPWHRRLFRVFDELRLTNGEILSLCTWEGTRAAKERFERESATKIETTTLTGVASVSQNSGPIVVLHTERSSSEEAPQPAQVDTDLSDEDETDDSIGVHLNQNLLAAAEARERGEAARFDLQWEEWMKQAIERNEITDPEAILEALRQGRPFPPSSAEDQASQSNAPAPVSASLVPIGEDAMASATSGPQYHRLQDAVDGVEISSARIAADTNNLVNGESGPTSGRPRQRLTELMDELHANTTRMQAENSAMQNFLSRTRTETAR